MKIVLLKILSSKICVCLYFSKFHLYNDLFSSTSYNIYIELHMINAKNGLYIRFIPQNILRFSSIRYPLVWNIYLLENVLHKWWLLATDDTYEFYTQKYIVFAILKAAWTINCLVFTSTSYNINIYYFTYNYCWKWVINKIYPPKIYWVLFNVHLYDTFISNCFSL